MPPLRGAAGRAFARVRLRRYHGEQRVFELSSAASVSTSRCGRLCPESSDSNAVRIFLQFFNLCRGSCARGHVLPTKVAGSRPRSFLLGLSCPNAANSTISGLSTRFPASVSLSLSLSLCSVLFCSVCCHTALSELHASTHRTARFLTQLVHPVSFTIAGNTLIMRMESSSVRDMGFAPTCAILPIFLVSG